MNKSDILKKLAKKHKNIKKKDLKKILDGTFEAMVKALVNGEKIEIRGLGTFKVKEKTARIARNPKNGSLIKINSRKIVQFKTGKLLKKKLFNK